MRRIRAALVLMIALVGITTSLISTSTAATRTTNPSPPAGYSLVTAANAPSKLKFAAAGGTVITSAVSGRYVSAELGYATTDYRYGMLRARATAVGPWEQFDLNG
jgi:hypothetical protein